MSVKAILLGTAQDGGVPQAGCYCVHCAPARSDPTRHKWVACLGLVDQTTRQSWLIDATPDLREQLHALHGLAPGCPLAGIVLTHAHIGHYAGLIHLGREAWNTRGLPVYASPKMTQFLRENAPWSQLVALGNIDLHVLTPAREAQLSPSLHLTPVSVPHRDEFSDTLALIVHGPAQRLFYCPDIDSWERWEHDLRSFVAGMDVALLDGTFFSADEIKLSGASERDLSQVPHPPVSDTVERLAGMDAAVPCDVQLIHLNHSNPLHSPGPERDRLAAQGIGVGTFGTQWRLD
jgi:pyrroloquinoline quinone biosynthesis protein B